MEDDPQFNAGLGSALQSDGKPRLTAAMMNGDRQSFSGVMSLSDIRHPSRLALELQTASSRVLSTPGCDRLAHKMQQPIEELITPKRLDQWVKNLREEISCDTVGAIVCHDRSLCVGTSTGGRGFEEPGRISDSATVAGTYASGWAAVSATGIGEELVDDALAARLETRVRDGLSLYDASQRCFTEALERGRSYGWIACDAAGHYVVAYTTPAMSFVVMTVSGQLLASSYPEHSSLS
jgi:L-asparaginase